MIKQPAVGQHIECRIWRVHIHRTQRVIPVFPHRFQCMACACVSAELLDVVTRFIGVARRAEHEHNLAFLSWGQFDTCLNRGAWVKAGAGSA